MRNIAFFAAIFPLLCAGNSAATLLSFADCTQRAMANHPGLHASEATLVSKQLQLTGAYSSWYPQINASATFSYGNTPQAQLGSLVTTNQWSLKSGLSATQNVFNGFADRARINSAYYNSQIAKDNLNAQSAQALYDLTQAFSQLLYAQENLRLSQDIAKRRKDNWDLVSLRYKAGDENSGNVDLAKAYWEQAQLDTLSATNDIANAQLELAHLIGWDQNPADIQLTGDLPVQVQSIEALEPVVANVPSVAKAAHQQLLAKTAEETANSAFLPTLGLNGNLSFVQSDNLNSVQWLIGFTVNWNLFDGFKDYYAIRAAKKDTLSATLDKRSAQNSAQEAIVQNQRKLDEAQKKLAIDQAFVASRSTISHILKVHYNSGLRTFEDWDLAEQNLIASQKAVLSDALNRNLAVAALKQALGEGFDL